MAEAPKRKTAVDKPAEEKKKSVKLHVGMVVEYKPESTLAVITGIDAKNARVYLDTPIVKWVPMEDCKKA